MDKIFINEFIHKTPVEKFRIESYPWNVNVFQNTFVLLQQICLTWLAIADKEIPTM